MTTEQAPRELTDAQITEGIMRESVMDKALRYRFAENGGAGPISKAGFVVFRAVEKIIAAERALVASQAQPAAEPVAWQWQSFLGNPDVIEPFWTEWEFCTKREYEYALATPDMQGRELFAVAQQPAEPRQDSVHAVESGGVCDGD